MFKDPLPAYSEDHIEMPFAVSILESSDYEHWYDEERIRQTINPVDSRNLPKGSSLRLTESSLIAWRSTGAKGSGGGWRQN